MNGAGQQQAAAGQATQVHGLAALEAMEREEAAQHQQDAQIGQAADQDAAAAARAQLDAAERERAAQAGAIMATEFAARLVQMRWAYVQVPPQAKQDFAGALAPVLAKHGGGMPEWLLPYREEINLLMVGAGIGFSIYLQVQQHNAQLAPPAAEDEQQQDQQQPAQPPRAPQPPPPATGRDPLNPNP